MGTRSRRDRAATSQNPIIFVRCGAGFNSVWEITSSSITSVAASCRPPLRDHAQRLVKEARPWAYGQRGCYLVWCECVAWR
ncbi:hypothetical protein E2C01_068360 [Portunus trituberculatus]|uniref:Uncharacterized protein n=1 Tax=Portunus trituberculatus TaxID=210409 RepID=A0A5B7HZU1_PORTR|nr:hypothetical protein [Portunus trituberculatus]